MSSLKLPDDCAGEALGQSKTEPSEPLSSLKLPDGCAGEASRITYLEVALKEAESKAAAAEAEITLLRAAAKDSSAAAEAALLRVASVEADVAASYAMDLSRERMSRISAEERACLLEAKIGATEALREFEGREKILLLGDSITEQGFGIRGGRGWVAILSDAYKRKADVINRGFGGYTTRTLYPIARRLLAPGSSYFLTAIFLGANDANTQKEQHVPVQEYRERLTELLKAAKAVSKKVLCIGPGPVDNRRWPTRSNAMVAAYNDAAASAASSAGVLFASLYAEATGAIYDGFVHQVVPEGLHLASTSSAPAWVDYLSDGLHLSCQGNESLARLFLKTIKAAPSSHPDALPLDFPMWSTLKFDEKLAEDGAAESSFQIEALRKFRALA